MIKKNLVAFCLYIMISTSAYPHYSTSKQAIKSNYCHESCLECGGIFGDTCIKCPPSHYLTEYGTCELCSETCLKCEGPNDNDCSQCNTEYYFLIYGRCNEMQRKLQVSNIQLPNSSIYINEYLSIYFNFTSKPIQVNILGNSTIDIFVAFNLSNTWFGIGFGKSMANADMITFEYYNNTLIVSDRYSLNFGTPSLDSVLGGTNDVNLIAWSLDGSLIIAHIQRALNTTDRYDFLIYNGSYPLIWAYGNNLKLSNHYQDGGDFGVVQAVFVNNSQTNATSLLNPLRSKIFMIHGIIEFSVWGVLAEIFSYIPKYFRSSSSYLKKHSMGFWFVALVGVAFEIIAFTYDTDDGLGYLTGSKIIIAHFVIGLIVLILSFIQCFGGTFLASKITGNTPPEKIKKIKKIHAILGVSLLIISKINLILGTLIGNNNKKYFPLMVAYVAVVVTFRILAELIYQVLSADFSKLDSPKYMAPIELLTADQVKLLSMIQENRKIEEIQNLLPRIRWILLGNRVYDVSNLNHPGGDFLIQNCIGKEISRYFFGAHSLEINQKNPPHNHSIWAFNLLNSKFIGYTSPISKLFTTKGKSKLKCIVTEEAKKEESPGLVELENRYLLEENKDNTTKKVKKSKKVIELSLEEIKEYKQFLLNYGPKKFRIRNRTKITKEISRFDFETESFIIKNQIKNVDWFGFYFIVSLSSNPQLKRNYSLALCMNPQYIELTMSMIKFFDEAMIEIELPKKPFSSPIDMNPRNGILSLFIKDYNNSQSLSTTLHVGNKLSTEMEIEIEGPCGKGLGLTRQSKGTNIIFAAGTGIIPFLDLLNYLLCKTMCLAIRLKQKNVLNTFNYEKRDDFYGLNVFDEQYDDVFDPTFKIVLIASFQNEEEIIGKEIIEKLAEINFKYPDLVSNKFIAKIHNIKSSYIQNVSCHFDREFIKDNMPMDYEKVFICGAPTFNQDICDSLTTMGCSQEKIVIL